jgi:hypothetical protein
MIGAKEIGGSLDGGKRGADFMGETGGELPDGGEAFGLLPAFDVLLELFVGFGAFGGGLAEEFRFVAFAVGEVAEEGADEEKVDGLAGLVNGELEGEGSVAEGGEDSGKDSAAPAEPEGGDDGREEEEILKQLAPDGVGIGGKMIGEGDGGKAGADREDFRDPFFFHLLYCGLLQDWMLLDPFRQRAVKGAVHDGSGRGRDRLCGKKFHGRR